MDFFTHLEYSDVNTFSYEFFDIRHDKKYILTPTDYDAI